MFSISYFSAKRMPYIETTGKCCFISCLYREQVGYSVFYRHGLRFA